MPKARFPYNYDWQGELDSAQPTECHEMYAKMQDEILPEGSEYKLTAAQWKAVLWMHPTLQGRRNGRC